MKKARAHQRYKTSDGRPCVGVTTALGMKNKPALVRWANQLGLSGIDSTKYVDALANIGTLIHYLIECDVKGEQEVLDDYTTNEIKTAKRAFGKWLDWRAKNEFELIGSEMQLSSDSRQFGGTCDIYAVVNGKKCVLDIKTSKACYSEHRTQTVAYMELLQENGYEVEECRIIRIGRDENEGFEDVLVGGYDLHSKVFQACLDLYWASKNIERSGA